MDITCEIIKGTFRIKLAESMGVHRSFDLNTGGMLQRS